VLALELLDAMPKPKWRTPHVKTEWVSAAVWLKEGFAPGPPIEDDDEREKERAWQRRAERLGERHESFVDYFAAVQLRERGWFTVLEIVDAVRQQRPEKTAAAIYDEIANAIIIGEFDQHGRPMIFWPDPEPVEIETDRRSQALQPRFLFKGMLDGARSTGGAGALLSEVARSQEGHYCWLPRDLVQRWMERRGYSWPSHFEPERETAGPVAAAKPAALATAAVPTPASSSPPPAADPPTAAPATSSGAESEAAQPPPTQRGRRPKRSGNVRVILERLAQRSGKKWAQDQSVRQIEREIRDWVLKHQFKTTLPGSTQMRATIADWRKKQSGQ
jgi:hypothetical protein